MHTDRQKFDAVLSKRRLPAEASMAKVVRSFMTHHKYVSPGP